MTMRILNYTLIIFLLLPVSACKDKETTPVEDEINQALKQSVIDNYNNVFLSTELSTIPWNGDAGTCDPGMLSTEVQAKTLQRINYFRDLAGLSVAVTFDPVKNAKCQEAALMMHANSQLSHSPPNTWNCYTADGAQAAGSSNIAPSASTKGIMSYMIDPGASNTSAGHRRWILYSRAKEFGHGSTDRYDALWVIGGSATPAVMPEFVAWPPKMVPAPFVWPRWTFSVPGGNFVNSDVIMTDEDGNEIDLLIESINGSYGDPTIVWVPTGIDKTTDEKIYNVEVSSVLVDGSEKTYNYSVLIVLVN